MDDPLVFLLSGAVKNAAMRLLEHAEGELVARLNDTAKDIGTSRKRFDEHNAAPLGELNKTRQILLKRQLRLEAEERSVDAVIIPLRGNLRDAISNLGILDDAHPNPIVQAKWPRLLAFARDVVGIWKPWRDRLRRRPLMAVSAVASMLIITESVVLRNEHRPKVALPVRLRQARAVTPRMAKTGCITPLDQWFTRRAGGDQSRRVTPEQIWADAVLEAAFGDGRHAKGRMLRRWRTGRLAEGRPSNDFILRDEYRKPCEKDDLETRIDFEAMLALHTVWRFLRQENLPDNHACTFLAECLAIGT